MFSRPKCMLSLSNYCLKIHLYLLIITKAFFILNGVSMINTSTFKCVVNGAHYIFHHQNLTANKTL